MPLSFPGSPSTGDVYAPSGTDRIWKYNGASWDIFAEAPASGEPVVISSGSLSYWWNGSTWAVLAADGSFSSVSALIRCDVLGANGFADLSGNATHGRPVAGGGALNGIGTGGKFGGPCIYSANNTNGFAVRTASVTPMLGSGDFTVEGWFYTTANGINYELFDFRTTDTVTPGPFLLVKTTNVLAYLKTGSTYDISGATTVSLNTWHHIHFTRASGTVYLGLDGTQQGSDLSDSTDYSAARNLIVGQQSVSQNTANIVGRFEHIRVTRAARYSPHLYRANNTIC